MSSTLAQVKPSLPRRKRVRRKTVGIDWTGSAVAVVEMVERADLLELNKRFYAEWPVEMSLLANPKKAGAWLRGQLKKHQINAKEVILSLPRRDAALRLIELPAGNTCELASMVRHQVAARSGVAVDDLHIDFLPQPTPEAGATTHALIVTFPKSSLSIIQAVTKAAGLSIRACGIGELALSALDSSPPDSKPSALVLANRKKIEFVIVRNGLPIASYAAPLKDASEEVIRALPAQIHRMLQGLPEGLRAESVSSVQLFGPNAELLCPSFMAALDVPVHIIETPCLDSVRAFALADSLHRDDLRLDFLHPRKAAPKKKNKTAARRLLVAVMLAAFGMAAATNWQIQMLDHQLANLRTKRQSLTSEIRNHGHRLQSSVGLQAWERQRVDWLETWSQFVQHLPDDDQASLTRIRWSQPIPSRPTIRVDGRAKNMETVLHIQNLLCQNGFQLQPHVIQPIDEPDHRALFTIRASRTLTPE